MNECPLQARVLAATDQIKEETGIPPSGWTVAKRIAADAEEYQKQSKHWEAKYHELLHMTGGMQ